MTRHTRRGGWLLVAAAAATLAGCGGGRDGSSVPATRAARAASSAQVSAPQPQAAAEADAFVSAIGVNTHLNYYETAYGSNFALIFSRLQGLGVRHIRDGVVLGQDNICREYQQLAAAGIHADAEIRATHTRSEISSWITCAGPALEALEAPNEYDLNHPPDDTNWTATLRNAVALLADVHGTFPQLKIVAPALTSESAYAAVGDLSGYVDYGNMHDYFGSRNPGTQNWGATDAFGTYGSIPWNMNVARQTTGSKPIVATETGYQDAPGAQSALPAAIKARYLIRTFFEHWNAGVFGTYVYELLDEGPGDFGSYGLLDSAGNAKPAYTMLRNVIAHLSDPGGHFTPAPLSYAMDADASVHSALFQKRSGSYCLALWVEAQEWDPDARVVQSVPARQVTLRFASPPGALTATTFDDNGNASSAGVATTNGSATLSATGSVTLVDITP